MLNLTHRAKLIICSQKVQICDRKINFKWVCSFADLKPSVNRFWGIKKMRGLLSIQLTAWLINVLRIKNCFGNAKCSGAFSHSHRLLAVACFQGIVGVTVHYFFVFMHIPLLDGRGMILWSRIYETTMLTLSCRYHLLHCIVSGHRDTARPCTVASK